MSIFVTATAKCPECGESAEITWPASVNADRRPDLRAAILDGSFAGHECPVCAATMRLPPHLTYVDLARGNWIVVSHTGELAQWTAHEVEARKLFEDSFGANAPAPAREMGANIRPRLVFGWPALREKLLCTELGLDDVTVELLKMATMRNAANTPVGDGLALRLVAADDEHLTLDATDDGTEARVATAEIPRSLYGDIEGDAAAWAPLRSQFADAVFVDLARLTVGD